MNDNKIKATLEDAEVNKAKSEMAAAINDLANLDISDTNNNAKTEFKPLDPVKQVDEGLSNITYISDRGIELVWDSSMLGYPISERRGKHQVRWYNNDDYTGFYNSVYFDPPIKQWSNHIEFQENIPDWVFDLMKRYDVTTLHGDSKGPEVVNTRVAGSSDVYFPEPWDIHTAIKEVNDSNRRLLHTAMSNLINFNSNFKRVEDARMAAGPGISKSFEALSRFDSASAVALEGSFLDYNITVSPYLQVYHTANNMYSIFNVSAEKSTMSGISPRQIDIAYTSCYNPLEIGMVAKVISSNVIMSNVNYDIVVAAGVPLGLKIGSLAFRDYYKGLLTGLVKESVTFNKGQYNPNGMLYASGFNSTKINLDSAFVKSIESANMDKFLNRFLSTYISGGAHRIGFDVKNNINAPQVWDYMLLKLMLPRWMLSEEIITAIDNAIMVFLFPLILNCKPIVGGAANDTIIRNALSWFSTNAFLDYTYINWMRICFDSGAALLPAGVYRINPEFNNAMVLILGVDDYNSLRSFLYTPIDYEHGRGWANSFCENVFTIDPRFKNLTESSASAPAFYSARNDNMGGNFDWMDRNIRRPPGQILTYTEYASEVIVQGIPAGGQVPAAGLGVTIPGTVTYLPPVANFRYQYERFISVMYILNALSPKRTTQSFKTKLSLFTSIAQVLIVRVPLMFDSYVDGVNNALHYLTKFPFAYGGVVNAVIDETSNQWSSIPTSDDTNYMDYGALSTIMLIEHESVFGGINILPNTTALYSVSHEFDRQMALFSTFWYMANMMFKNKIIAGAVPNIATTSGLCSYVGNFNNTDNFITVHPKYSRKYRFEWAVKKLQSFITLSGNMQRLINIITIGGSNILYEMRMPIWVDTSHSLNVTVNGVIVPNIFSRTVYNDCYVAGYRANTLAGYLATGFNFPTDRPVGAAGVLHHPMLMKYLIAKIFYVAGQLINQRDFFGLTSIFSNVSSMGVGMVRDAATNQLVGAAAPVIKYGVLAVAPLFIRLPDPNAYVYPFRNFAGIDITTSFSNNTYYGQVLALQNANTNIVYCIPIRSTVNFVTIKKFDDMLNQSVKMFNWSGGGAYTDPDSALTVSSIDEYLVQEVIANTLYNDPLTNPAVGSFRIPGLFVIQTTPDVFSTVISIPKKFNSLFKILNSKDWFGL